MQCIFVGVLTRLTSWFSVLLTAILLASSTGAFAQENTAAACADGIDNDGDGLIDCADGDCVALPNNGCSTCTDGRSFADVVLSYEPGCFIRDPSPQGALGSADYNGSPLALGRFCFLGDGGKLKLGFTNNLLTNSGDSDGDVFIFEIGGAVENCDISLRPEDAATVAALVSAGVPDPDGDGYYYFGFISGATTALDIDALVPGLAAETLLFNAIEIRDIPDRGCAGLTPGADIDAVCALSLVLPPDCAGTPGGTAILDSCGVCLETTDPAFNQSCTDCAGVPNGTSILDDCGVCLEPTDPAFNQSCADCAGAPNGTAIFDDCGICLEPTSPIFNVICADCEGTPNGTAILDDCGVCLQPTDPSFNTSCSDCAGVPNGTSILDDCGVCLEPTDPTFNASCTDCAGVVNGTSILDDCGVCLETTDPSFNQSCTDCAGVVNGTSILDDCGVCLQPSDPSFNTSCADCEGIPNGMAILDSCGVCLQPNDPDFNASCTDCAGILFGTSIADSCGVCGPPSGISFSESCRDCNGELFGNALLDSCGVCLLPSDPDFDQSCLTVASIKVYLPTAFSPNNDGTNDLLRIFSRTGGQLIVTSFRVFDRWGNIAYSAPEQPLTFTTPSWDGTTNGDRAESGLYVYVIQVRTPAGLSKTISGEVTLLR
ncbi:MAG: gliding motility-associated C-terminal domain-containing protein [Saprospiraceae bacterium]